MTRLDPSIDFDWGNDAPDVDLPADGFSVRWTGEIWIEEDGASTFVTVSNDGVRLWVDGYRVIDNWTNHGETEDTGQIRLAGGRWYPITLEYYDDARDALIVLAYESERTPRTVVTPDRLRPPAEAPPELSPGGLRGEYFDDERLADLEVVRIDSSIDFDWDDGSPDSLLGPDGFSIRWLGEFLSADPGEYEFSVTSDDGVRLWIGDQLIIDDWTTRSATENTGTVNLAGGSWHAFKAEYFDAAGGAEIRLQYRPPGGDQRSIPSDHLRPAVDGPVAASTSAAPGVAEPATPAATPAPADAASTCDTTIQALVDAAAPGDTVTVPPCIYRETVAITKPLTLDGQGQAEIRGSDVWSTGWIRRGNTWIHFNSPELPNPYGSCRGESERCHWPHQVFLDGAPLRQVATEPHMGEFAVAGDTIILAEDPIGHTVEVTARPFWIVAKANDVTITGFAMRHAGNPAQSGAINIDGMSNWNLLGNTLLDAHGVVVVFANGSGFTLESNELARGGSAGVGIVDANEILLRGNNIHHHNTEDFHPGWSAGGLKAVKASNMVVESNEVHDNSGPGLWCDIDCSDVIIRNNRVHHNWSQGIQYEISRNAEIYGNTVWENGWGFQEWCFGAGILIQNSSSVRVYENTLGWNARGISVISQVRGEGWDFVTDILIHSNAVVSSGYGPLAHIYCDDWASTLFDANSNNRGVDNSYWYPDPECGGSTGEYPRESCEYDRFGWGGRAISTLAEFNSVSGSVNGRYIEIEERNRILAAAGIPLMPEWCTTPEHDQMVTAEKCD